MGAHDLNLKLHISDPLVFNRLGERERGQDAICVVMETVPWKTFARIIENHRGDAGVCTLERARLLHILALAN